MNSKNPIIIYKINEKTEIEIKITDGEIWCNQDQIVSLFQSSKSNISEHIKHILEDKELDEFSVVRNFRITASDNEKAIKHAKNEYEKFKQRFLDNPTEKEKLYLENMQPLFLIEKKNK